MSEHVTIFVRRMKKYNIFNVPSNKGEEDDVVELLKPRVGVSTLIYLMSTEGLLEYFSSRCSCV